MAKPVLNTAWLSINTSISAGGQLSIYDAKGALISKKSISLTPGLNHVSIPMHFWANGVYALQLQYGEKVKTFKLVKQN